MTSESAFIAAMRALAPDPAARGLMDDAAVLAFGGKNLVLTHDMIVESVHFLSEDPPEDVAWKLVAVNLSDLAGKGARPLGLLLGFTLAGDDAWDAAFVRGFEAAADHFATPLLGGDTVSLPAGAPRALGLTAIGEAEAAPSRAGAKAGDLLWVSGTIGDGAAGLRAARGEIDAPTLLARYRRPEPRLEAGRALAPLAHAMMDISDGLLIDAARMAEASGLRAEIALDRVPLSPDYRAFIGDDRSAHLGAATGGDDYELLVAAPQDATEQIQFIEKNLGLSLRLVGKMMPGSDLGLTWRGEYLDLPGRLGYEHVSK
ncbi:thiamine-phosphate kinase [Allosphingosinicella humi]